ncbi:hypothetical protein BJ741DRAFT_621202 [Chytriomyces cf. hyalinus JEL632]|nr:hypothetical protein BJ741DRAFT_621202 [Chytriomyces cf. hyalinus JEL632]
MACRRPTTTTPPTPLATPIPPLTAQTTIDPHTFLLETASLFPTTTTTADDDNIARLQSFETKPSWEHISSPAAFSDVNYYISQFAHYEHQTCRYLPDQEPLRGGSPPNIELNSPPKQQKVPMHSLDAVEDSTTCHGPLALQQQQPPVTTKPSKKVSRSKPTTTATRRAKAGTYKCQFDGCTRSYAHSRNLSAHVRLDHSSADGLFYCSVCQMGFRYSQTRNRHERNYHA